MPQTADLPCQQACFVIPGSTGYSLLAIHCSVLLQIPSAVSSSSVYGSFFSLSNTLV